MYCYKSIACVWIWNQLGGLTWNWIFFVNNDPVQQTSINSNSKNVGTPFVTLPRRKCFLEEIFPWFSEKLKTIMAQVEVVLCWKWSAEALDIKLLSFSYWTKLDAWWLLFQSLKNIWWVAPNDALPTCCKWFFPFSVICLTLLWWIVSILSLKQVSYPVWGSFLFLPFPI